MRKNKKKNYIGLGLLFLIGLSILLYPMISDAWNKHRDNLLISKYSSSVSSEDNSEKIDSMWKAAEKYNEQIKQESVPDAFSVRDGEKDSTYESLLNLNGDGMMGYVEIPVINVKVPIIITQPMNRWRKVPDICLAAVFRLAEKAPMQFFPHIVDFPVQSFLQI